MANFKKPDTKVPCRVLIIANQEVEHWEDSSDEDDDDDAEGHGHTHGHGHGHHDHEHLGSEGSLQKYIMAGSKGVNITEVSRE